MGDFSVSGLKVTAVYGSDKDAKEIPAGKGFEIQARGKTINTNPGMTPWTTCMTVLDITHNKVIGYDNDNLATGSSDNFALSVNVTMPGEDTRFRVKIFATQHSTSTSPDKSRW